MIPSHTTTSDECNSTLACTRAPFRNWIVLELPGQRILNFSLKLQMAISCFGGSRRPARSLLACQPCSLAVVKLLARLLISAGDNASAIDLLRRLSERQNPAGPRWARLDLALSYLMAGNYEKAAAQSQTLIEAPQFAGALGEEAASAWSVIGIAKARIGQSDAAVDAFRQAAKLDSHREEHWLNLTRELMASNRFAKESPPLRKPSSRTLSPRSPSAFGSCVFV